MRRGYGYRAGGMRRSAAGVLPEVIAGVTIGDTATIEGQSFRLLAGDDFTYLGSKWDGGNLSGKYANGSPTNGARRISTPDRNCMIYMDARFKGYRSQSPTALGYEGCSVSNGVLSLTAQPTPAELLPYLQSGVYSGSGADANGKPKLISGKLCTWPYFMPSTSGDWVFEGKVRFPAGTLRTFWPSLWVTAISDAWPNDQEFDMVEGKQSAGTKQNTVNINGNTSDGGANATVNMVAARTYSISRFTWVRGTKVGTTIKFYDDADVEGTLALVATYPNARVARFDGGQDIRMEFAADTIWNNETFVDADWTGGKSFEIDWWRWWGPSAADQNTPMVNLGETNLAPGGAYSYTIPSQTSLYGGAVDYEHGWPFQDNFDTPSGITVDLVGRTLSGTVPTTEGGRNGVLFVGAKSSGGAAKRAIKYFNIAPAVQATMFGNQSIALSGAANLAIAYTDFHSGNLGPHSYTVNKTGLSWLTVAYGASNQSVTITGTAPASPESGSLEIICTNAIGQTTTITRTVDVEAWAPTDWTALSSWWDPDDATTVFEDAAGTNAAEVNDVVLRLNDKKGSAHLSTTTFGPDYVFDATVGRNVLSFVNTDDTNRGNRLTTTNATLRGLADGSDDAWVAVLALKRGAVLSPSGTFLSWSRKTTQGDNIRCAIGNNPFVSKIVNGAAVSADGTTNSTPNDEWYVLSIIHSGTTTLHRINGVDVSNNTAQDTASVTLDEFGLGSYYTVASSNYTAPFGGRIGEIFIADQGAVDSHLTNAEAYLMDKYRP
jgi:hypothetical protein